jgi:hypothetical protein
LGHVRERATEGERQIDRERTPWGRRARGAKAFGKPIDLHFDGMNEVGKAYQAIGDSVCPT